MNYEDATPQEGLANFFDFMWGDTEGFVYLPTLNRKTEEWTKKMYQWPSHKDYVIRHVLSSTAKGLDTFFAPAIFETNKPERQYVKGSHVVWTEFDGNAPDEWPADMPQEGQNQGQDGLPVAPPPSMRVQSSQDANQHVYWRLEDFNTDTSWYEGVNRSISYTYRADTSGWDANQILRPPYTTNYKHDLPVTVVEHNIIKYNPSRFRSLKPIMELVADSIDTENLPTVESVIAKYAWDEDHFKMFMDPQIPEGSRSSALMRLGYFGAEVGMSDAEIYALLENADARWGKFAKRSDKKKRLTDIVNRAKQKHPHGTSTLTFAGLVGQDKVELNQQYVYGFNDFLKAEIKVEWLIEGLLEVGGFGMIAAAPGVGKTQLSIQAAICLALGNPFFGWSVPTKKTVVFFSLEMGQVALRHFLDTISQQYSQEELAALQENFYVVPLGESLSISRPESIQFFRSILDDIKPDVIFIDSVSKLGDGELNGKTAKQINDFYSGIRARYDQCSVFVIHHNRKANGEVKRPKDLDDVYGDRYLTSDMSTVITLWREDGWPKRELELNVVKARFIEEPDPFMIRRNEFLHFSISTDNFDGLLSESESLSEDGKPVSPAINEPRNGADDPQGE